MADGWRPVLAAYEYGPELFLAVDKDTQTAFLFSRKSPLQVVRSIPCATGQSLGDKKTEGDLRTPEGVYFLGQRVDRDLDFELYGDVAYTLNFPNPVDRIEGKTGSGIWIHGRGRKLLPRDTRGCVALKTTDLESLGRELPMGQPVIIARKLTWTDGPLKDDSPSRLAGLVRSWAEDWQGKRQDFFSHYDPEAFSKTEGTPFEAFVGRKKRIFAAKPWLQVMVANIRALQGPDYWVTWFDQYYRAPDVAATVGKRLYWRCGDQGRWRIVGREYTAPSQELEPAYLAAKSDEVGELVSSWAEAWKRMDLEAYLSHYDRAADQQGRAGLDEIGAYKQRLWASRVPLRVDCRDLKVDLDANGLRATFRQDFEDDSGYRDQGLKTLVLRPADKGWLIVSEEWSAP
ncbi:MAG: L,D-transpeptidase family protein [Desulfovibrionaceae bacterium]|nr:L,D-transpeptidase family protein [Desulfovibrionaceae bacterium]